MRCNSCGGPLDKLGDCFDCDYEDEFADEDWPDAPGFWWCSRGGLVESRQRSSGDFVIYVIHQGVWWGKWQTMMEFHCDGAASFTRLIETNPYAPNRE